MLEFTLQRASLPLVFCWKPAFETSANHGTSIIPEEIMKQPFTSAVLCAVLVIPYLAFAAETKKVSDISKDNLAQEIAVEGTASSFRASTGEKSPNSFKLKDSSGSIRIVIWPDVFDEIAGKDLLEKDGSHVKAEGKLAEYRDNLEIHVDKADAVKISAAEGGTSTSAETAKPPRRRVSKNSENSEVPNSQASDLTKDKLGKTVELKGTASSFRESKGEKSPNLFTLKDASGEITVVIWPDVYEKISNKESLETDGSNITLQGKVSEYKGKIQVSVNDAATVKISVPSADTATASKSDKTTTKTH
jgi:DNA/RNA endonuclease YhcR with UshA esterase domain